MRADAVPSGSQPRAFANSGGTPPTLYPSKEPVFHCKCPVGVTVWVASVNRIIQVPELEGRDVLQC